MKIIFVSPSFARFCYTFILVNYNFEQVIISRNYFPSNYLSKHISEYISYFPLLKLESAVDLTWVWISLFSRSKVTKEYLIRAVNVLFSLRAYDAWRMHCLCWTLCISTWHVVYVVLTLNAVDIPSAKVFINVFIFLNYTSKSLKRTLTLQI